jgi:Ca2+/Na+ antiporter
MLNKYVLVDIAFIVGTAIVLIVLNEFDKMDIVKIYAVPILYACYVLGRVSVKLVKKEPSSQESKLHSTIER